MKKIKNLEEVQQRKDIFSENLERIRKERGKTRKELADAIGVNETSFGAYCVGRILPPVDKIFTLAVMLDCSIVDLTGDNPRVKGREVWQYRFERSIEILNRIGFLVEDEGEILIIKEKPKFNFSANEISAAPQMPVKLPKNLLNSLVDGIENFALEKNISFKEAFQNLVYSEQNEFKIPLNKSSL